MLVTVKIATDGRRCGRWCGFLKETDEGRGLDHCALFRNEVLTIDGLVDGDVVFERRPACLALDGGGVGEPNGVGDGESSAGAT